MSFDLDFFRNDGSLPTEQELTNYFTNLSPFSVTKSDSGSQYWYANEETGVYCSFDYEAKSEAGKPGIAFNLNYGRPSFFAHEAMPLVTTLCSDFDLEVDDPQEEYKGPAVLSGLIASWLNHNQRAVRAVQAFSQQNESVGPSYYPEQRAMDWWKYAFARRRIEADLTEDLFVPTLLLLELEDQIQQMSVLAKDVAQLIPECDFVIVETTTPAEPGLVSYRKLRDALEPLLSKYTTSIGDVDYIPQDRVPEVVGIVSQLNPRPLGEDDLTRVETDSFHNVEL